MIINTFKRELKMKMSKLGIKNITIIINKIIIILDKNRDSIIKYY